MRLLILLLFALPVKAQFRVGPMVTNKLWATVEYEHQLKDDDFFVVGGVATNLKNNLYNVRYGAHLTPKIDATVGAAIIEGRFSPYISGAYKWKGWQFGVDLTSVRQFAKVTADVGDVRKVFKK